MLSQLSKYVREGSLSRELIFEKCVIPSFDELRVEIEGAFIRAVSSTSNEATIRIFQSNGTRDDHLHVLRDRGLREDEPLETQLDELFNGDYCIAINFVTNWSARISDSMRKYFVAPWIESNGPSLGGIDVYAFLGKYAATPFGVHLDNEDSFLIALGPNTKYAYVDIREPERREIPPIYRIEDLPPEFERYELDAGDLIYIPGGQRHVLATPKYSVMLGVAPYPFDERVFLKSAFDKLGRLLSVKEKQSQGYGSDVIAMEGLLTKLARLVSTAPEILTECVAAEYTSRSSSGFLTGAPCFEFDSFTSHDQFRLRDNHKIEISRIGHCAYMHINGRDLFFSDWKIAAELGRIANLTGDFSVESIVASGSNCIPEDLARLFITEMNLAGAVEYV